MRKVQGLVLHNKRSYPLKLIKTHLNVSENWSLKECLSYAGWRTPLLNIDDGAIFETDFRFHWNSKNCALWSWVQVLYILSADIYFNTVLVDLWFEDLINWSLDSSIFVHVIYIYISMCLYSTNKWVHQLIR